jgi:hypothetical protein
MHSALFRTCGKWVRRVNRHRRQHRVDLAFVEGLRQFDSLVLQLFDTQNVNPVARQQRQQFLVPAFVLLAHEELHRSRHHLQLFARGQAVGTNVPGAVLDLLQKAGNTNFHELIEVVGGNGEELYAFEKWICRVSRLFQDTLVEGHPLQMAVEIKTRVIERDTCHQASWGGETPYLSVVTAR